MLIRQTGLDKGGVQNVTYKSKLIGTIFFIPTSARSWKTIKCQLWCNKNLVPVYFYHAAIDFNLFSRQ